MILLYTDFGWHGPYVGEMKAAIAQVAPNAPVIDLMHDAPAFDAKRAAYHLAALVARLPKECIVIGVVDPGVGSERDPVLVEADGRRFVGPDNGMFELVFRRARDKRRRRIGWKPDWMSASFHGRDLFAPFAARLFAGLVARTEVAGEPRPGAEWPDSLGEVVYIDRYGNAMTGIEAAAVDRAATIAANGHDLRFRRTFSEAALGEGFWYENASGLIEIAVNQGAASRALGLAIGSPVTVSNEGP